MTTILAIESSCDETGVGIANLDDDGTVTLLADEVASSVDEHARFGGVVPEIASRAHLEAMVPTVHRALADAGVTINRPPRDGHMAFVKSPDGISIELLQDGHLEPQEPWASMENTGSW